MWDSCSFPELSPCASCARAGTASLTSFAGGRRGSGEGSPHRNARNLEGKGRAAHRSLLVGRQPMPVLQASIGPTRKFAKSLVRTGFRVPPVSWTSHMEWPVVDAGGQSAPGPSARERAIGAKGARSSATRGDSCATGGRPCSPGSNGFAEGSWRGSKRRQHLCLGSAFPRPALAFGGAVSAFPRPALAFGGAVSAFPRPALAFGGAVSAFPRPALAFGGAANAFPRPALAFGGAVSAFPRPALAFGGAVNTSPRPPSAPSGAPLGFAFCVTRRGARGRRRGGRGRRPGPAPRGPRGT